MDLCTLLPSLTHRRPAHCLWAGGLLCACLAAGSGAARADLWAFVDGQGVTHFAAEPLDGRYALFFRGNRFDSTAGGAGREDSLDAQDALTARARVQAYFDILPAYKSVRPYLRRAAERHGLDYALLKAVIATESGFDAAAVSPKGALGLMQLMPGTAERFGVAATRKRTLIEQLHDPAVNVLAGARYLRHLLDLFDGQLDLALAAYNAGEGAVHRAGRKIPPFKETQNYVKTVLALYRQLQPQAPGSSRIRMTLPPGSLRQSIDEKQSP